VVSDLGNISVKKEMITFKESFTSWLRQQNVDQKIKEILQKEVE
jgi:hypothetical protein